MNKILKTAIERYEKRFDDNDDGDKNEWLAITDCEYENDTPVTSEKALNLVFDLLEDDYDWIALENSRTGEYIRLS